MDTLALTPTEENLWWGAIIGGFVIVLAVAALLTVLVVLVGRIDRRVVMVRDTLKAAAITSPSRSARSHSVISGASSRCSTVSSSTAPATMRSARRGSRLPLRRGSPSAR